jgi:hypothetical protein
MIANIPRYSRHNAVRCRRVNLKTIDPCDLVDEENYHRRHVIDSSHFNMNEPFWCRWNPFLYEVDTPHRAYEAVWRTPEAPFQEPYCSFLGTQPEGTFSRANAYCMSLRFGPGMLSFVSKLACIKYLYFSLVSVRKTSFLLLCASCTQHSSWAL